MKVLHVVGSRPNFMKTAPLMAEMALYPRAFQQVLVHTGQHYDHNMSRVFFEDLEMSAPDAFLNVGSGTHADQTARVMIAFEPVVLEHKPDLVVVVGDVNSTLACALVCAKLLIPVAHVEAGLRSFDRTMPEEINRLLTDQVSDLLFTPSQDGDENLAREGIAPEKVHFVGNIMIDSLVRLLPKAAQRQPAELIGLDRGQYVLATLHRPSNVDDRETFVRILQALETIGQDLPVVFPVHPRTRKRVQDYDFAVDERIRLIDPLGYVDFLALQQNARLVITDSGGVQEETTYLGVPCVTVRPNTERPVTVQLGTNTLANPESAGAIVDAAHAALAGTNRARSVPRFWDGRTAGRIVEVLRALGASA